MKKERKGKKALLIGLMVLLIIGGMVYMALQMKLDELNQEISNLEIGNIDMASMEDGIYHGEYYKNDLVGASLKVKVEDHEIKGIAFIDHKYGKGKKAEAIVNDVMKEQTLDVDVVSGATSSSKVILKAIENALMK